MNSAYDLTESAAMICVSDWQSANCRLSNPWGKGIERTLDAEPGDENLVRVLSSTDKWAISLSVAAAVLVLIRSEEIYIMPGLLGVLAALLGDNDAAFQHFDAGLDNQSLILSWLRDPLLDEFKNDSRYIEIFDRVGLEP
jgi:hypothetical protein